MKLLLTVLFLIRSIGCLAQSPLLSGAGIDWTKPPASASVGPATFMQGLMEAWEWTNYLATNQVMTNWVGLNGTILTNGDTTLRPTNTALGVGFPMSQATSKVGFTNVPFVIGSNYIISCFFSNVDIGDQQVGGEYLFGGTNVNNRNLIGLASASGQTVIPYYRTVAGVNQTPGAAIPQSKYLDISFYHSNNANGGSGAMYIYTNGNFSAGVIDSDQVSVGLNFLGFGANNGAASIGFQGFIQGYYVITNASPSAAYFSNIHYYHTNYLMHGLSP